MNCNPGFHPWRIQEMLSTSLPCERGRSRVGQDTSSSRTLRWFDQLNLSSCFQGGFGADDPRGPSNINYSVTTCCKRKCWFLQCSTAPEKSLYFVLNTKTNWFLKITSFIFPPWRKALKILCIRMCVLVHTHIPICFECYHQSFVYPAVWIFLFKSASYWFVVCCSQLVLPSLLNQQLHRILIHCRSALIS